MQTYIRILTYIHVHVYKYLDESTHNYIELYTSYLEIHSKCPLPILIIDVNNVIYVIYSAWRKNTRYLTLFIS